MIELIHFQKFQWAARISKKYREALNIRGDRQPPGWTPVNDDEMIWRTVKLDRCGCERKVKGHGSMMVYDGIEEGVNSSVSTCSRHSYLRGAKQRVRSEILKRAKTDKCTLETIVYFTLLFLSFSFSYCRSLDFLFMEIRTQS